MVQDLYEFDELTAGKHLAAVIQWLETMTEISVTCRGSSFIAIIVSATIYTVQARRMQASFAQLNAFTGDILTEHVAIDAVMQQLHALYS